MRGVSHKGRDHGHHVSMAPKHSHNGLNPVIRAGPGSFLAGSILVDLNNQAAWKVVGCNGSIMAQVWFPKG